MIELSPGELFFIGQMMQAKYIDYQYVTAIEACGDLADVKTAGRDSLEKKGLLEEDFSGELELSEDVKKLMEPVFFGEIIESLVVTDAVEIENMQAFTFHINKEKITKVSPTDVGYSFEDITKEDKDKILNRLVPALANEKSGEEVPIENEEDIKEIISRKFLEIGKTSIVDVYFETKTGQYCKENDSEQFISVTADEIKKNYGEV